MNHYVSTYRRDYASPQVSCQLPPPQIAKSITCTCTQSRKALEQLLLMYAEPDDRSCTSRVERSLKLCFTKDKLKKPPSVKYPDPCGEFRDERSARVNANRFKTTYQVDYSDPAAARMARRDKPSTIVEKDSQQLQCCLPIKITIEPDFRPLYHSQPPSTDKSPRAKIRHVSREKTAKCGKKREDDAGHFAAWKSEYQDSIGKIGHIIIKAKFHQPKKNVAPVYITSS
ncbi:uncharacterized protein LOC116846223 [Odontomachus brunneus]|uniref:uncharacterized protein LOC116846223 n=1 Tax=Odontomachus brunneus TaxID=486640 RepID=UPI0013F1F221|nr:uncharacterized protein LOC116846223 [Odontomachus brunneus]